MSAASPVVADAQEGNPENPMNVFHPFSSLPPELRLMVWKWASLQPRIVHVRMVDVARAGCEDLVRDTDPEDILLSWLETVFKSNNVIPAVLHTCVESRVEGLKWYTLDLSGYWTWKKARVYFNHAVDTMYFEVEDPIESHLPISTLFMENNPDGMEDDEEVEEDGEEVEEDDEEVEEDDEEVEENDGAKNDKGVEGDNVSPTKKYIKKNSPVGNKNDQIKRLAVNLDQVYRDSFFGGEGSKNLDDLTFFENLQELTLFHQPDSSIWGEQGDLISSDLTAKLHVRVRGKRRTNAKLQRILEKVVRETYLKKDEQADKKDTECEAPQVKIMQITRLPRAW